MQIRSLLLVCLCVFLLCTLCEGKKGKKGKGGKGKNRKERARGKWSCETKTWHSATATEMAKKIRIGCRRGQLITGLHLEGVKGSCKGLPPGLYVKSNQCHWHRDCTLSHDLTFPKMLKIFEGNSTEGECIVEPDTFRFAYQCTTKKAQLFDLLGTNETTVNATEGIIRSHADHPWLYRTPQVYHPITLIRPEQELPHFVFTIRSLSLAEGDSLTISSDRDSRSYNHTVMLGKDKTKTDVIKKMGNDAIKVTINVSTYTKGGEGFVICFRWTKWKKRYESKGVCSKLLAPKKCKAKTAKKGKKGKKG